MAKKYIEFFAQDRHFREIEASDESAGSSNAGEIVGLDADGKINPSMLAETTSFIAEAGGDLVAGDILTMSGLLVVKAQANDADDLAVAYAGNAASLGGQVLVRATGIIVGRFIDLTPGATYFLVASMPGEITEVPPVGVNDVFVQSVGFAITETKLLFKPDLGFKSAG